MKRIRGWLGQAAPVAGGIVVWFGLWYWGLGYLSPGGWRWAGAIAIGLLPVLFALGMLAGLARARDMKEGLHLGVNEVMQAAERASDVKAKAVTVLGQARGPAPAPAALAARYDGLLASPATIAHRKAGTSEIVEM